MKIKCGVTWELRGTTITRCGILNYAVLYWSKGELIERKRKACFYCFWCSFILFYLSEHDRAIMTKLYFLRALR